MLHAKHFSVLSTPNRPLTDLPERVIASSIANNNNKVLHASTMQGRF
jgi:hypothetical protein